MIQNAITDSEVRTKAINMAANYLINNNIVTPNDLSSIQVEFAYAYFENGALNALYSLEDNNSRKYYFRIIQNAFFVGDSIDEQSYKELAEEIKNQYPELNKMPSNNMVNNIPENNRNNEVNQNVPEKVKTNTNAIISIVVAIIGIFIFGWLEIVGLGLGVRAIIEIKKTKQKGFTLAVIGIILSVIGLILYILTLTNISSIMNTNKNTNNNNIDNYTEPSTNTQKEKDEISVNLCNNLDAYIEQYNNSAISFDDFATTAETFYNSSCSDSSNTICFNLKMIIDKKNETYELEDCSKFNENDETGKSLKNLCESRNSLTKKNIDQKDEIQKAYISNLKHDCALERE